MIRKLAAELLGTALLASFAVGVATLSFGFGTTGSSFATGVVATALAFGLTLLALAYVLGPAPGRHVNPVQSVAIRALSPSDSVSTTVPRACALITYRTTPSPRRSGLSEHVLLCRK